MKFGETLREKREELGYSLKDVEEETKIRKFYLEALEKEEFSFLPPKVYAVGFVKKYARLLGLDEKEMVAEFKNLACDNEEKDEIGEIPADPLETGRKKISSKNVVPALIFLVIAILLGRFVAAYITDSTKDMRPDGRPPVQESQDNKPEGNKQEEPAALDKVQVVIEAKENCWLYVVVDGVEQFTGILYAGQEKNFKGDKSVYVKAGNAGGIDITFNGKKIPSLGEQGEVKERLFSNEE